MKTMMINLGSFRLGFPQHFPTWEVSLAPPVGKTTLSMRIIAKKALIDHWEKVPAARSELEAWHAEAKAANWATPADVKAKYGNASILKDGRVVFNICGNKHRLVVWINYDFRTVYVRFLGTHSEYDKINAQTV
jgi:mRNA interferase HigB